MKHLKAMVIVAVLITALFVLSRPYITKQQPPKATSEKRFKIERPERQQKSGMQEVTPKNKTADFSDTNLSRQLDNLEPDTMTAQDPLEAIHNALLEQMAPDEAEKMFDLYKRYLDYKRTLAEHKINVDMPQSPEEDLDRLADVLEYRNSFFDPEEAEMLFGDDLKKKEYDTRREAILNDTSLYGAEKEEKLNALAQDMGEEQAETDNLSEYDRYQQALQLYEKDLAELTTDEERQDFMEDFKYKIYNPDQLQAFEEAEEAIEIEKERKKDYYAQKEEIMNDPDLSDTERAEQIHSLQDEIFGDEADDFREAESLKQSAQADL